MSKEASYRDYVSDESSMHAYLKYQQKYKAQIRESDKVLLSMIANAVSSGESSSKQHSLLDIGCSTGNFLRHVKSSFPGFQLVGGDASPTAIDACKADEQLAGIRFDLVDLLDLPYSHQFDFVVANAVTYLFEDDELDRAIQSIQRALKPGGSYLSFEWIHPFHQEIKIIETSRYFPEGHPLHARSARKVSDLLQRRGFEAIEISSFEIPVDLQHVDGVPTHVQDAENLMTYTLRAENGKRLMFRGTLYQPWSHLQARKAA